MQAGSISRRYAKGIFDAAKEAGALDRVFTDLSGFGDQFARNAELGQLFSSPTYSADAQMGVISGLLKDRVHRLSLNFLMLLASRHRMALFPEIIRELGRLRDLEAGIVRVHISSAVPLSKDVEERLVDQLSDKVGKKIAVTREVDPSLVGGMVTRVGNVVFDGSLATQFSKIKRHLEHGEGL